MAESAIGNEFFAVLWGDEFIVSQPPRLAQMLEVYKKYKGAVISSVELETEDQFSRYGIPVIEPIDANVFKIKKIVEKPGSKDAPSKFASHGGYILPPEIFKTIKKLKPGKAGEVWLVEAINELIEKGFPVYGCKIKNGDYYDTGNKIEYLKTVIEFAIRHPEFGDTFKNYLKNLKL
jgi:UTP--glucose-1-phosphate uridylyltransferase